MFQVAKDDIRQVDVFGGRHHAPTSVDLLCPACRLPANFSLADWGAHELKGAAKAATCARCKATMKFILRPDRSNKFRLYVDAENAERQPMVTLDGLTEDEFPTRLREKYKSALRLLSIGEHDAAATTCRTALEGAIGRFRGQELGRTPLAHAIRELAGDERLSAPILGLASAVKDGGNLGAHYDSDRSTSAEDAEKMVDFLELFLTLLFILPGQVEEFARSEETDDPSMMEADPHEQQAPA